MKKLAIIAAIALSVAAGAALAQVTNFRLYSSLTGNEVINDMANATGAQFKASVLASYVDTVYANATLTTVAALPTCNSARKGYFYMVTDASSPTYGATLTGSSTSFAAAICDGSAWTAH